MKLGIDFIGKGRYNVELYERLQTGGVTEMPNIKSSKKDVIRSKIAYEKNILHKFRISFRNYLRTLYYKIF